MTDLRPSARTLSNDVRLLGDTLGAVLRAHGGDDLLACVEAMRKAAKRARDDDEDANARARAREELAALAAAQDPATALEVVRAFTLYFQLVNIAEDVHRTRELRRREIEAGPEFVSESFAEVVGNLAREGWSREEALATLRELSLRFVFTAHPTEARRRTTERLLSDVRRVLEALDRRVLSPTERRIEDRRLRSAVEALWEHAAERRARPEVLDEVKAGLWYLRHVLLDAVPRMHRRLRFALERHFGPVAAEDLPMPVSFGSWMGGDRDGNPFVTDAVTERTLELHRRIILDRYGDDLDVLVDPLAAAAHRLPDVPRLDEALARAAAAVPELVMEAERRNPDEPLRRLLTYMRERIARTRTFTSGAYPGAAHFLDDLCVLRDALRALHASALPEHALLDLILRVRCFGFSLVALDVREDARVQRRVVAELLSDPSYPDRPEAERREALARLALPGRDREVGAETRRFLDLFETIRRLQARFGPESIPTFVLSMTEAPSDVLAALRFLELYGLTATVDLVPLLETLGALEGAGALLGELYEDGSYRAHLSRRGDCQELLVGYSDSMKEAGILASRVGVLAAQRASAEVSSPHGVRLRVFHGRGGSVSRGGGPTYRAIRGLPREAFSGDMKITEQGETRAFHFGNPDLAVRYLEQTVGAALVARSEARRGMLGRPAGEAELLRRLAEESHRAYREFVASPGLVQYFEETTPLDLLGALHFGSRPARRGAEKGERTLADLRAIPWVFAWSQSRHVITGWYGVGSALAALGEAPEGQAALERLYRESPFFFDLLDNVQMTLGKADLPIAARYAELASVREVRDRIFGLVTAEHERTRLSILQITRQAALLDEDPVVQRSIRLRNPYVDPLSYLQVEALRHLASPEHPARKEWERAARVAVHGIAAGLRNTG